MLCGHVRDFRPGYARCRRNPVDVAGRLGLGDFCVDPDLRGELRLEVGAADRRPEDLRLAECLPLRRP